MKITTTRDDITGRELTESQETKITVGDVTGTLDLSPDSLAALLALASGEGPAKLTALLAPPVPFTARRTRKGSGGNRDGKPDPVTGATPEEIRAWAEQQGITVSKRGRVPSDVRDRYITAHGGNAASAASTAGTASTESAGSTPDAADANTDSTGSATPGGKTRRG